MDGVILIFLPVCAMVLLATVCLPSIWANRNVNWFRQGVTFVAGIQFAVAVASLLVYVVRLMQTGQVPAVHSVFFRTSGSIPIEISAYYDGVAALMFALVSFVGWVICRYSISYLDGEATQGRYFRWTAFTLGAVSLMVISGNLLMFVVMWVMTSLGLHQLLMHYGHRPAAKRAAWTKFAISRVGDAALIVAMFLIYYEFKTFDFAELFAAAGSLSSVTPAMHAAGFLLVAGAATKSAQLPFHTWLPQTMETPTPVSALMHAGIVNAGGYLIIRTSQIEALTPWSLTTLAIIGGATACFASIVALTQTSVKKALAYSTIAQMGFMLLQCGLGAYSAAMLHILAHSLYKAHAFLSSGSIIAEGVATSSRPATRKPVNALTLAVVAPAMLACLWASLALFGMNLWVKPGGLLLGSVFSLALTYWVGQAIRGGDKILLIKSTAIAVSLCLVYAAGYFAVDRMVGPSLPSQGTPALAWFISALILVGFVCTFLLNWACSSVGVSEALKRMHIHAANGFYLESTVRQLLKPIVNR
jgi:NAD(P)H-quinone oxidoreductase subunit 5